MLIVGMQWEIVKAKTNLVDEMIARKTDD